MDKLVFTEKIADNLISYLDNPESFNHKSCFNTCVQDDDIWFNDNKKRMLSFCEWTCYSILDFLENAETEDEEEGLIPVEPEKQADKAQADSQTCDMNCVGGQCNFDCEGGQCQLCEDGQCVLCGDCQDCGPGYVCVDGVCTLIDEQAPEDDKPVVAEDKPSEDVKPTEDETPAEDVKPAKDDKKITKEKISKAKESISDEASKYAAMKVDSLFEPELVKALTEFDLGILENTAELGYLANDTFIQALARIEASLLQNNKAIKESAKSKKTSKLEKEADKVQEVADVEIEKQIEAAEKKLEPTEEEVFCVGEDCVQPSSESKK